MLIIMQNDATLDLEECTHANCPHYQVLSKINSSEIMPNPKTIDIKILKTSLS